MIDNNSGGRLTIAKLSVFGFFCGRLGRRAGPGVGSAGGAEKPGVTNFITYFVRTSRARQSSTGTFMF